MFFSRSRHGYSETGNSDGRQTEAIEADGLMAKL